MHWCVLIRVYSMCNSILNILIKMNGRSCGSFLEIVRGEGIRSAQLEKSSLLRNRACWIHPLEFRYAELGERLQEERQPGAPCHVSSDDI